ncbi:MAG: ROK family protein [Dehalococcoidia bacterium]
MATDSLRLYGAIDLGGTKVRSIVAEGGGRILGDDVRPSQAQDGLDVVLERMVESLETSVGKANVERARLRGLGIASAGAVDAVRGIVPRAPQLPGWEDVPLARILAERTGLPTRLENDATAAALGEHRFGGGRGSRYMLYFTVSTGVGGGIIIDGKMYGGKSGAAGELGHVVLDMNGPPCGCGARGCLESFASGTAIAKKGEELADSGESPILARLRGEEGPLTAEMMQRAAEMGDDASQQVFREAGHYLGVALASYVNIFDPEVIVVGGGVAKAGDLFLDVARATMEDRAMEQPLKGVRLVLSELGDFGGTLGMVARMVEAEEDRE